MHPKLDFDKISKNSAELALRIAKTLEGPDFKDSVTVLMALVTTLAATMCSMSRNKAHYDELADNLPNIVKGLHKSFTQTSPDRFGTDGKPIFRNTEEITNLKRTLFETSALVKHASEQKGK